MSWKESFTNFFKKKEKRRYEGAAKTRRTSKWNSPSTDADGAMKASLVTLRNRSRDLVRNNPAAKAALDILTDEIVGEGIIGTIKHPDKRTQERLNRMFKDWAESKQPDFNGQSTLYGLQRLVVRSMLEGGETLVRSLTKRTGFPLEFQLMEGDHLPLHENQKLDSGGRISQGIEYNRNGKRVAYHLLDEHPGSNEVFFSQYTQTRVDADEIAHVFRIDRNGQSRGIPALSSVLVRLKDLDDYNDAEIVKQKIAACWAVFVEDVEGADLSDEDEIELLEKVEPGMIEVLPPGKQVRFANPPSVEGYKDFNSVNDRKIAKALGISYEAFTGDFSDTNFSSARMGHIKMQKTIKGWRKHTLKPLFLDFVAQKFLQMAFLMGENVTEANVHWTAPKTEMIDPTKEVPAARDAIRAGLTTLSEEIKKTGRDAVEVLEEWSEDAEILDEKGLFFDSDPRRINRGGSLQDNLVNDDPNDNNVDVSDKGDDDNDDSNDDEEN